MLTPSLKALSQIVPFFFLTFLCLLSKESHAKTDVRAVTKPTVEQFTPLTTNTLSSLSIKPAGCVQKTETLSVSGKLTETYTGWALKAGDNWLTLKHTKVSNNQILLELPEVGLSAGQSYPLYIINVNNKKDSGLKISICPAFSLLPLIPADAKTD